MTSRENGSIASLHKHLSFQNNNEQPKHVTSPPKNNNLVQGGAEPIKALRNRVAKHVTKQPTRAWPKNGRPRIWIAQRSDHRPTEAGSGRSRNWGLKGSEQKKHIKQNQCGGRKLSDLLRFAELRNLEGTWKIAFPRRGLIYPYLKRKYKVTLNKTNLS